MQIPLRHITFISSVGFLIVALGCGGGGAKFTAQDQALVDQLRGVDSAGTVAFVLPESTDYGRIPQDPNNPITAEKVRLGKLLFHETGILMANKAPLGIQSASCASCHNSRAGFQANLPQGIGEGGLGFGVAGEARTLNPAYNPALIDTQAIRSPSAMNAAYQPNLLWNGQFGATAKNVGTEASWTPGTPKAVNNLGYEGLETQAIAGQTVHRLLVNESTVTSLGYKGLFDGAFGDRPVGNRYTAENAGLAISAYERTLLANRSPWQLWLRGKVGAMTPNQKMGASLFFGKGACVTCHSGPSFASMEFYGIGMKDLYEVAGVNGASPASPENLGRGGFTGNAADNYKFKVPQLYNLKDSKFFGHGASFRSVRDVIAYKNAAVPENGTVPLGQIAAEFVPLGLTETEIDLLTDFVENALYDPTLRRYVPNQLPSNLPFPVNDPQS